MVDNSRIPEDSQQIAFSTPAMNAGHAFGPGQSDNVHLMDYWHIIRSRLGLFFCVFALVVGLVAAYSFIKTPIYRGRCKLMIEPVSPKVTRLQGVYDPTDVARDFQARRDFLQTQMEVMRSDHLLSEVFAWFRFGDKEEFRDAVEKLKAFRELIGVEPTRNTFLVDITFDWKDPQLAADVANYLASLYVDDYRKRQLGLSGRSVDKLREQLDELRKTRREALEELNRFKKEKNIIQLDDAQDLVIERITRLNEALIDARVDEATASAAVDSIAAWRKSGFDIAKMPEALDNQTLTAFKIEHLRAQAELLDLLNKYGKTHPTVQTQERVVEIMGKAMRGEVENSIASVQVEFERARLRSQLLSKSMADQEQEAFRLDEIAGEYRLVEDAYRVAEDSYRMVMERINEIKITRFTGEIEAVGNIQVIVEAVPPMKHAYPRKGLNLALAVIVGSILAAGLCLFLDYLDSSVKSKEEVEQVMGAPVLGFVPQLDGEAETSAVQSSDCQLAEAFRTIRTSLGLSIAGRTNRAFLVTSANPGEGKTLTAFNLAVALARDGRKILLMECDMRRPRMRKLLGPDIKQKPGVGLSKVLVKAAELEDVVFQHPEVENLSIALCGAVPPNPAELLGSNRFREVFWKAVSHYDVVLVDGPPVLNVADSAILAGSAMAASVKLKDGTTVRSSAAGRSLPVIFVVRAFTTDRQEVAMASDQIRTVQGSVVGAILNNVDAPRRGYYGYYYGGRYYYRKPVEYRDSKS